MTYLTSERHADAVPIEPVRPSQWSAWLAARDARLKRWVESTRFQAAPGTLCLVSDGEGNLERVLVGIGEEGSLWDWASLPVTLPERTFFLDAALGKPTAERAALGWALGTYRFDRYQKSSSAESSRLPARLIWPEGADPREVERTARATFLVRDLINTPASDMGPEELADAAQSLAAQHHAACTLIAGDELLSANYPAIHAVGRASERAPRLIDLRWGEASARKVTLAGKGVCFDSGGLDLKPAANMKLMKKDMGGAAHVLGLASMIMDAELPVRLRVLVPAVENSVSGNALRPLDVVQTRKGLTIEIGNTDAEGRVILADALAEGASEKPELLVDFATLTGAARVALGKDLPAMFANDDQVADDLARHAAAEEDPLWRMPLWKPYRRLIESKVADLNNAPEGGFAGAITAALFLAEFVDPELPWVHLDLMAWNTDSRPGRPEGGEAMGLRAFYALIAERFGEKKS